MKSVRALNHNQWSGGVAVFFAVLLAVAVMVGCSSDKDEAKTETEASCKKKGDDYKWNATKKKCERKTTETGGSAGGGSIEGGGNGDDDPPAGAEEDEEYYSIDYYHGKVEPFQSLFVFKHEGEDFIGDDAVIELEEDEKAEDVIVDKVNALVTAKSEDAEVDNGVEAFASCRLAIDPEDGDFLAGTESTGKVVNEGEEVRVVAFEDHVVIDGAYLSVKYKASLWSRLKILAGDSAEAAVAKVVFVCGAVVALAGSNSGAATKWSDEDRIVLTGDALQYFMKKYTVNISGGIAGFNAGQRPALTGFGDAEDGVEGFLDFVNDLKERVEDVTEVDDGGED